MANSDTLRRSRAIDASLAFPRVEASGLAALRRRQAEPPDAVPTFLPSWNRASRGAGGGLGLGRGWSAILAGLTGDGKTLLALNEGVHALRAGVNVLYVSLEMTWSQLMTRVRPIVSGGEVRHLEPGLYFDPEAAQRADEELLALPGKLHLNPDPIFRLGEIEDAVTVIAESEGLGLVVVDYAQLVSPSGDDRKLFEAMTDVSRRLSHLAQTLGVAVLIVSQLNRTTTRDTGAPGLDGLYGSARLGFDADQVLVLDYTKSREDPLRRLRTTELRMVKNRHGPQVTIGLEFSSANLRFRETEPGA